MKQTSATSQMRHSKQGATRVHKTYDASAAAHKRKLVANETNTSEIANAPFKATSQTFQNRQLGITGGGAREGCFGSRSQAQAGGQ